MSDTESTDDVETLPVESEEEQASEEAPPEEAQDGDEESPEEPEEDGDDAAEEPPPKKRRNVQKRISELTRAKHEATREAQSLKQQLEVLQANAAPVVAPKQQDYQSYDEFVLASARWEAKETVRQEWANLGKTVQENQSQAEQTARAADWETKLEDARDKYDDFDDVVLTDTNPVTEAMARAFAEESNGADVAYHLASNPKLAREIAALSPTSAVLRIGKLSAKLAEKPTRKQTTAPNPVKTVKSGTASGGLTPYNATSMADYAKARKGQEDSG